MPSRRVPSTTRGVLTRTQALEEVELFETFTKDEEVSNDDAARVLVTKQVTVVKPARLLGEVKDLQVSNPTAQHGFRFLPSDFAAKPRRTRSTSCAPS